MILNNLRLALRAIVDPFFYINFVKVTAYKVLIYALRMYRFNNQVKKRFPQLVNRSDLTIQRPENCEIDPSVYFGKDIKLVFSPLSDSKDDLLIIKRGAYLCDRVELAVERQSVLTIGEHTSIRENSRIAGNVTIGNFCGIAQNVYIGAGAHIFSSEPWLYIRDQDSIFSNKNDGAFVEVHDDVFIGANVFVESNVVIGKGAIIGANAVIRNDVYPYSVIGTNGKTIAYRLNFHPPARLHFLEDMSLPYLYFGIRCDMGNALIDREFGGLGFNSDSATLVMNLDGASSFRLCLRTRLPNFLITNLSVKVNEFSQEELNFEQSQDVILLNFDLNSEDILIGNKIFQKWDKIEIKMDGLSNLMFVEAEAFPKLKGI